MRRRAFDPIEPRILDRRAPRGAGAAPAGRRCGRWRRAAVLGALFVFALGVPRPAAADEHDPQRTGHPLRILAYAVHPIGVALDYLIMRPAHWVVEREPFRTIFGNED